MPVSRSPAPATGNLLRPRTRRNDFGGTLGGPVWIPKLYNGRNKSFFFFSGEEYRLGQNRHSHRFFRFLPRLIDREISAARF